MRDIVISVENLSKRYLIGHRTVERDRYIALRDVIEREARHFVRKTADFFHGRQIIQGDHVEEFWALKDVSFEVKQGEVVGIVGRNGAGKSTLLKILGRITEPTAGRARLRGRVGSLLEVGTGFHPELTGRENIYLNGTVFGMSQRDIRQRFDEIVAFAEVERFLDTPVKRYSSGMYVRLAFAVAAHLEPEILVIDEVLAVGDMEFRRKCLGKISQVAKAGRTVLFVSHNQMALRSLCTHGLVLKNGMASAKKDIAAALADYSLEAKDVVAYSWKRIVASDKPGVRFDAISVHLHGMQPNLRLRCSCVIVSDQTARPMMITMDVTDANAYAIMQAEPSCDPFIEGATGTYHVNLDVELPPLVPGIYGLDFWIGPHNTETYDRIRGAIKIEIVDSPSRGRTFPHRSEHGYIVPQSKARVLRLGNSKQLPVDSQLHRASQKG